MKTGMRWRTWGGTSFAVLVSFASVACPRKSTSQDTPLQEAPLQEAPSQEAQPRFSLDERFRSQLPLAPLFEKKLPRPVDAPFGGLTLHRRGTPLAEARLILLLLHGYGAAGDDLVSLSSALPVPEQTAFLFPEAPYALPPAGRAWGPIVGDRYGRAFEESRTRLLSLLRDIRAENAGASLVIGGFSQGAIMSLNLLTQKVAPPTAAILFSPTHLFKHQPSPDDARPPIFLSHGRADQVLPFEETLRLRSDLEDDGYAVSFMPFEGGHGIARELFEPMRVFLANLAQ